ncbi:hypothetical protein SRABI96_01933 [Peribacillus sp. Bi96]|nr:hypothetical protein SRABI96_01933 [Peribacillus sp. Bi96]
MGIQLNQKNKELHVIDLRLFLLVNLNYKKILVSYILIFFIVQNKIETY